MEHQHGDELQTADTWEKVLATCLLKVISQYIDIVTYRGRTEMSGGRAGHLSAAPQLDHNMWFCVVHT
jgi:hypothetical protein